MDIQIWHALDTISVSPERVRAAFHGRATNESVANRLPHLFLPSAVELHLEFDLSDVLTPLDARELEGFRLVRVGESPFVDTVGEIDRTGGKGRTRAFDRGFNVSYALVHAFLDSLALRFSRLRQYPGLLGDSTEYGVAYSLALTRRLLLESMTSREEPLHVPRLAWPSPGR